MGSGYRIFIIQDGNLVRMTQKSFYKFTREQEPELKRFANQDMLMAMVYYNLLEKRPDEITSINSFIMRVSQDGSLDSDFQAQRLREISGRIEGILWGKSKSRTEVSNVVDATSRFDRKRYEHNHPKLSNSVLEKIQASIFGLSN